MTLSHALKSSGCCIAILVSGCVAKTPPVPVSPSIQPPSPTIATPTPTTKPSAVKEFENRLRLDLEKKAGIQVQTVTCPITVSVATKTPFNCEAIAEGKPFTVVVNPNQNQKSQELRWNTKGLLVLPKLEQTIQQGIQKQFRLAVKATCGGKVSVAKPGETFQCQVTDNRGQTRPVTVRVDDEAGNVTWKL